MVHFTPTLSPHTNIDNPVSSLHLLTSFKGCWSPFQLPSSHVSRKTINILSFFLLAPMLVRDCYNLHLCHSYLPIITTIQSDLLLGNIILWYSTPPLPWHAPQWNWIFNLWCSLFIHHEWNHPLWPILTILVHLCFILTFSYQWLQPHGTLRTTVITNLSPALRA